MKKTIKLLTLITFITNYCFSQNKPLPVPEVKPVISTSTCITNKIDSITAVTYKMLYDNQVKSSDEIRNTVYYALGGLASAMLLVIASNWVFNDKKVRDVINEIDTKIKGVKNDTFTELTGEINKFLSEKTTEITHSQTKLQEEVTLAITNITTRFNEFAEKIREEIKEDNKALTLTFEDRIKNYSENLLMQIQTLEKIGNERAETINQKISLFEADFNEKIKQNQNKIEFIKDDLTKNITRTQKFLQSSIFRNAGYMWEEKEIYTNAVAHFVYEGEVNLELGSNLTLSLSDIFGNLKKIDAIPEYHYSILMNFINKIVSVEYAERVQAIRDFANKLPRKK